MTRWSYSPEIRTATDEVRLLIDDTNASAEVFKDGEIVALLARVDNIVLKAAALACRVRAGKASATGSFRVFEGLQMDGSKGAASWLDLADRYDAMAAVDETVVSEEIDAAAYEIGAWGGDASEFVG